MKALILVGVFCVLGGVVAAIAKYPASGEETRIPGTDYADHLEQRANKVFHDVMAYEQLKGGDSSTATAFTQTK